MSVENQPNKSPIKSAQFKGLTCESKTKENQWRMGSNINRLDQSRYKRKSRWHQKKICKSRWRTRKIERASFAIVACKQLICFIIPLPAKIKLFFFFDKSAAGKKLFQKQFSLNHIVESHSWSTQKKKIIVRPQAGAIIGRGQTHTQKTFATTTTTTTAREGDEERDTISSEDVSKKIGFLAIDNTNKKWESKEKGHSCVL